MRRSGEDERLREGAADRKKDQKEWLDNTLPDLHPCTAGNKEEEHILRAVNAMCLSASEKVEMTSE